MENYLSGYIYLADCAGLSCWKRRWIDWMGMLRYRKINEMNRRRNQILGTPVKIEEILITCKGEIIEWWKFKRLTVFASASALWPGGRGGTLFLRRKKISNYVRQVFFFTESSYFAAYLGSSWFVLPRPYKGITFSLLIPDLQTGHNFLFGLVSSHWCKQGQLMGK